MCRAAGYFEHALYVAQAAEQPEVYLDVLVEDCRSWDEALAYLQSLPRSEAAAALQKYGKVRAHATCSRAEPLASLGSLVQSLLGVWMGWISFLCFMPADSNPQEECAVRTCIY